jgi:hypothetical protein
MGPTFVSVHRVEITKVRYIPSGYAFTWYFKYPGTKQMRYPVNAYRHFCILNPKANDDPKKSRYPAVSINSMAARSRSSTRVLPSTSITSKIPGLTVVPVNATRTG